MTPFDYYMQNRNNQNKAVVSNTSTYVIDQRPMTSSDDESDPGDVTLTTSSVQPRNESSVRFFVGDREPVDQREDFEDEGLDFDDFEFDEASLFDYEYKSDRKSGSKISPAESGLELDEDTNFSYSSFHFDGIDDQDDFSRDVDSSPKPHRHHFTSYDDEDDVIKPRDSSLPIQINFGNHYHHQHHLANKSVAVSHHANSLAAPSRQRQRNCVAPDSCCSEHKTPKGESIYDEMKRMSRESVLDTTKIFGELPTKQTRRLSSHFNPLAMS